MTYHIISCKINLYSLIFDESTRYHYLVIQYDKHFQIFTGVSHKSAIQLFYIMLLSMQNQYSNCCVHNFQQFPEFPTETLNPSIKIEPHCKDSSFRYVYIFIQGGLEIKLSLL